MKLVWEELAAEGQARVAVESSGATVGGVVEEWVAVERAGKVDGEDGRGSRAAPGSVGGLLPPG